MNLSPSSHFKQKIICGRRFSCAPQHPPHKSCVMWLIALFSDAWWEWSACVRVPLFVLIHIPTSSYAVLLLSLDEARFCLHVGGADDFMGAVRLVMSDTQRETKRLSLWALKLVSQRKCMISLSLFPVCFVRCIRIHTTIWHKRLILKSHATDWRDYAPGSCSL